MKHAVACNCGTSALHVSLILAGVRADDEVIVPAVTFIAPVNAVRYVGALPVFVDCDEYCCIDVAGVRRFLAEECAVVDGATVNAKTGRRVAAIIPVHVFGTAADMDPIIELARDLCLAVVEDASEALGSRYKGRMCGALGADGLPQLQRQQDRHERRRRRHPDRRRRAGRRAPACSPRRPRKPASSTCIIASATTTA